MAVLIMFNNTPENKVQLRWNSVLTPGWNQTGKKEHVIRLSNLSCRSAILSSIWVCFTASLVTSEETRVHLFQTALVRLRIIHTPV